MSEGTWDPQIEAAKTEFVIEAEQLQRFIAISQGEELDKLPEVLSGDEQQALAPMMQLSRSDWLAAGEAFSDEELIELIRFFTLAEELPGWEAGNNSPVIALAKILKKRGRGLDKELLLWIKANSRNQFLPHGSLL